MSTQEASAALGWMVDQRVVERRVERIDSDGRLGRQDLLAVVVNCDLTPSP